MVAVSCDVGCSNSCPRSGAVILEDADVLEPAVALQILNAQRRQTQKLFDFKVARSPEMAVMTRIFQQNFMRPHRSHAVVKTIATARRLALDVVERMRMDDGARRPGAAVHTGQVGDDLRCLSGRTAKPAGFGMRSGLDDIITGNHPGTGDGIFAEFHAVRRTKSMQRVKWQFCNLAILKFCDLKTFRQARVVRTHKIANYQIRDYKITNCSMSEPSTPLMRQYAAIKKEHPNALLFFRLGDFYELFFDDAVLAARELQITLTSRNKEKGVDIPMCGVPYHAAEGYIAKLIRRGFKVAVCEQVEDPRLAKKLVRREVTRVVTPGTAADSSLSAEENNFLAAVAAVGERVGFAALDLSTGEFRATEFAGESAGQRIQEELEQLRPKEMLYGSSAPLLERTPGVQMRSIALRTPETPVPPPARRRSLGFPASAGPRLRWTTGSLLPTTPFRCWRITSACSRSRASDWRANSAAASAAGAILYYIRSTQRGTLDHVDRIGFYERQNCLVLDAVTVRNLELIEPLFAGNRRRSNTVPLPRCDRHPDGQAVAADLDAAPVARIGRRLKAGWMPSRRRLKIRCGARSCGVRWTGF